MPEDLKRIDTFVDLTVKAEDLASLQVPSEHPGLNPLWERIEQDCLQHLMEQSEVDRE